MTEFTTGIHNACMTILKSSSFTLALIYTFGHIVISMTVIYFMTGATLFEAGIVALVEPAINGVWFYILHSFWRKLK